MRATCLVALASALPLVAPASENFTVANVETAQGIIDEAVAAYGGSERLDNLGTLIIEIEDVNLAVGQSRAAAPPWDENASRSTVAMDLENSIFATRAEGSGGGFEFHNGTIINGQDSYQFDFRAGTRAEIAEPDFATTSGPFTRVTPALLVRQVRDRAQNAYYLGEVEADGERFDVIGFSMTVGPAISLYFEKDSRMLRRSERVLPNFGLVEYRFKDYETVAGIPFNRNFTLLLNGDENIRRRNMATRVNQPIGELLAMGQGLAAAPQVVTDPLSRQELADGVYLIGGTRTYALFVEMDDHIVAIGGTAGIPQRIELLREVTDKPIRFGVLTHHHFDHVLGVPAYEAEGATVVAAAAHEQVVRNAAENGSELPFKAVEEKWVIEEGRRVEIFDIGPTAHSDHLLMAWLPEEGILFEADHFALPNAGDPAPATASTRSFAAALEQLGMAPRLIASAHSPRPATMMDLQLALDKNVALVSQR